MSLQLSTALVNAMTGGQAAPVAIKVGTSLAYVGGSPNSISSSNNDLVTLGFSPGQAIYTFNATTPGNNLVAVTLLSVAVGTMTFAAGTIANAEIFPASGVVVACKGGSLRDQFMNGVLRIFSGVIPSTADSAITGTLLAQLTLAGGAFTAGQFANGLQFGAATAGVIGMLAGESWSGNAVAAGVATHYRFVGNSADDNSDNTSAKTLPRIQGTIGTSSTDATMPNATITIGQPVTAMSWTYSYSPS
jgi:hypothetical protein